MRPATAAVRAGMVAMLLALTACAGVRPPTAAAPIAAFSGRLLMFEPARRWQAIVDWRAESPEQGWLRLLHAASGRVVELRWAAKETWLRDSFDANAGWQSLTPQQLRSHGIALGPQQLAAFLLGRVPTGFRQYKAHCWRDAHGRTFCRRGLRRLEFADVKHGRRAILIIGRVGDGL